MEDKSPEKWLARVGTVLRISDFIERLDVRSVNSSEWISTFENMTVNAITDSFR